MRLLHPLQTSSTNSCVRTACKSGLAAARNRTGTAFCALVFAIQVSAIGSASPVAAERQPERAISEITSTTPSAVNKGIGGVKCNQLVLGEIRKMISGGGYATTAKAVESLRAALRVGRDGALTIDAASATPSFCSGATYLLFLRVVRELQLQCGLNLAPLTIASLVSIHGSDGHGIWGRWNANGPGTARLFFELGIGRSFMNFESALPGDFMKIWWTDESGKSERGHSVAFSRMYDRCTGR
jgi:hypothetical protein